MRDESKTNAAKLGVFKGVRRHTMIHTNATVYHHYLLQYIFAIISQLRFNESANGYVMIAKYTNNCRVMPATTLRKLLLTARVGCSYATRTMTITTTNNTTTATSRHSS